VLYGVSADDGLSFLTASAGVIATALAASFLPAWRGSRVDPLVALRHE
jgi:ABC-type lipoprotein release transport system permease subunit